jgi:pimeloyl-ACP methyl ester carboxylesterase
MSTPNKSGYAPVNGVEVYYEVHGTGDPLVLLHGGFGAIEMFGPALDRLAQRHTVIAPDLQGHGRTLPFDRPMTFENMADDIAGLIEWLGYETADVVGYSMGGGVALNLGLRHPELVRRLVLVSTPYANSGWHQYNLDGMAQIGPASAEGMKQSPMYEMYAAIAPDPEKNWPRLHEQMGQLLNAKYDHRDAIPSLSMPTTLIVGDWDSVRTAHAVEFFEMLGGGRQDAGWDASGMNANRLAILPGLTHYTIFAAPALVDTVERVLAE